MLGKLEEWVLLASIQAGENAMPSAIYARMESADGSDRPPSFGAVYTTLSRMVAKGLLIEDCKSDDAGKKRRVFTISGQGRQMLTGSMKRIQSLGGFRLAGGAYA